MSERIALQARSMSALAIRDRQPQHEKDKQKSPRQAPAAIPSGYAGRCLRHKFKKAKVLLLDDPVTPATLFHATLIANTMPRRPYSVEEISLQVRHEWTPPPSTLHLRDRTI